MPPTTSRDFQKAAAQRLTSAETLLRDRKRVRRFKWATNLRYETGRRDTGETIGFLITAKAIYDWVESQLP